MKLKNNLKRILTYGLLVGLAGIFGCGPKNTYLVKGEVVGENYKGGSLGLFGEYEEYTFLLKEEGNSHPTKYIIRGDPSVDFDLSIDKGDRIEMWVSESDLPGVTTKYHIIEINDKLSSLVGNGRP